VVVWDASSIELTFQPGRTYIRYSGAKAPMRQAARRLRGNGVVVGIIGPLVKKLFGRIVHLTALPEGAPAVGAGLIVVGLTAYGFLVVSARVLGPERYASLAALWALLFIVGPGFFFPLEQEVARALAARRARGVGGGDLVRRAALAGGVIAAALVGATALGAGPLLETLFDDQMLLWWGLTLGLLGYGAQHLLRGTLSGNGRFGSYGVLIGVEGIFRLVLALGLALFGVVSSGSYGLAVGLAPFAAVAFAGRRERDLITPGPGAPWSELSSALGYLLAGSVLMQLLMNAGPLTVKVLASETEQAAASQFLASLVIARVPLFLFQAVQASLLPKLAGLAGAGRHAAFRSGLRRLLLAVVAVAAVAIIGAWALGPWVVRFFFGEGFALGRRDLGYLAAASGAFMVALTFAQALIALSRHAWAAVGWLVGVAGFAIVTAMGSDLILRVELGFLVGSVAAAATLSLLTYLRMRYGIPGEPESLVEAVRQEIVEP